jgi:hypothetical protein
VISPEGHDRSLTITAHNGAMSGSMLSIGHVGYSGTDDDRDRRIAMAVWLRRNDASMYRRLRRGGAVYEDRIDLNDQPPRDFLAETGRYDVVVLHNIWGYPGLSSFPDAGATACSPHHSAAAWLRRLEASGARYVFSLGPHFNPGNLASFETFLVPSILSLRVLADTRAGRRYSAAEQPLTSADMTGARLRYLHELRVNEVLDLSFNKLQKRHYTLIGGMARLGDLSLVRTNVRDSDLRFIVACKGIRKLNLDETVVSDAGLEHVCTLRYMACLSLNHTRVTDTGLRGLRGLGKLEWLSLVDTVIGDAGLKYLSEIASLRYLSVVQTRVSVAALNSIREALPGCWIDARPRDGVAGCLSHENSFA